MYCLCFVVDLSYIISGGDEALDILKISYIDDNFIYTRLRTIDLNGYRLKSLSVNYWSKEVLWVDTKNHVRFSLHTLVHFTYLRIYKCFPNVGNLQNDFGPF